MGNSSTHLRRYTRKRKLPNFKELFQAVGTVTLPYLDSCNCTIEVPTSGNKYYKAPDNTWLACDSGITHCAAFVFFNSSEANIFILVFVLPQVSLCNGSEGKLHFFYQDRLQKWAVPVLVPLLMGLGIAGSAAVGTTALIKGEKELCEIGA
uniref:Uncharacterized protein n=1 Tax=Rousettus aegyptiacus TaxID=9407 RepID=A0A7J8KB14_ROUAE|nr:hypothetical protein HJG63_007908 [Rousettus aegyptiacus]